MKLADIIGHDLDEKYRIESEIGRGGMGTVYLATHLGTERPVAVKIVSPEFMKRPEFVERFRREARAAGRLRHPNVVDVTDFGFAPTDDGQVAYLVMEYLDGCTLGEVLDEEKRLPVTWALDIVDQICSAVHEAHEQGIIHRDLKPDNIWLEPNQRGGYTVKVLDFGIAKLEPGAGTEHSDAERIAATIARPTSVDNDGKTTHDGAIPRTILPEGETAAELPDGSTLVSENAGHTDASNEGQTKIMLADGAGSAGVAVNIDDPDSVGTKIIGTGATDSESEPERTSGTDTPRGFSQSISSIQNTTGDTPNLTRVGAVLGTPLYMSPEQCRGEALDARSDIYSIGIIAYQMLSGRTPFEGDWKEVMEAHKSKLPPPLNAKKVRRKLKRVVMSAIEKDPNDRPESAQALAIALRSRADGILGLIRRAAMIYTEHMPRFVSLAAFFVLPLLLLTVLLLLNIFLQMTGWISRPVGNSITAILSIIATLVSAFCTYLTIGTICWTVTQKLSVPLRPLSFRRALSVAANKWRTFAGTGMFTTILSFIISGAVGTMGFIVGIIVLWPFLGFQGLMIPIAAGFGVITGLIAFVFFSMLMMLLGPVVMMEGLRGIEAMRRSAQLIRRSYITSFSAFAITFLMPLITAGVLSLALQMAAVSFDPSLRRIAPNVTISSSESDSDGSPGGPFETKINSTDADSSSITIDQSGVRVDEGDRTVRTSFGGLKQSILESLMQILLLPIQTLIISFTSIIIALLYMKTRQAGGESLQSLLFHFSEGDGEKKQWQKRIHKRLVLAGRTTPKVS